MVNKKPEKVEKKSAGKDDGTSKKTAPKKKIAVKKKETTVQKKKSAVKKTTASKVKKPVPKKKPVKKTDIEINVDLEIKTSSMAQIERIDNVINKLSKKPEQHYVTTVPGVFRKAPVVQETVPSAHTELPITGLLNYLKNIF